MSAQASWRMPGVLVKRTPFRVAAGMSTLSVPTARSAMILRREALSRTSASIMSIPSGRNASHSAAILTISSCGGVTLL